MDQLRLVRKYTNNLTIIYDGDSAGVKAALRGLDMALEEGLNVKLVLIPDKEDPDSYVNKLGAAAFRDFIAVNKKDFIIFQVEVALKDAGNDTSKKASVVNQIAETISKINKAEDFTKQQDYIRQCSELMKIEETGLNALVNKFIRDRVIKQESKQPPDEFVPPQIANSIPHSESADSEILSLLMKDEMQERAVVRALLEFGLKEWDGNKKVADYFFEELSDEEAFDNLELIRIIAIYKTWYEEGIEPTTKTFLYNEDQQLSKLVSSLVEFPYELSTKWKEAYEMPVATREDNYREEIVSCFNYLKLKKIKQLIDQNQRDLEKHHTSEEQLMLIQTHQHLKKIEKEILYKAGTVIIK